LFSILLSASRSKRSDEERAEPAARADAYACPVFGNARRASVLSGRVSAPVSHQERIHGQTVAIDTGAPLAGARVTYYSVGKAPLIWIWPFPPGAGWSKPADLDGRFDEITRAYGRVVITVSSGAYYEKFEWDVSPSTHFGDLLLKVGRRSQE
jgi:hypothetical protein